MITDIETYFTKGCGRCDRFATPDCSTRRWIDGLEQLRRICFDVGLEEALKWAHPCYVHAGRNVAIIGAFRGDYRLIFFHAAMDADPALAEAFHKLTPGRQTSYVIHVGAAKKPETRVARIAKARDKILAGKGALER